MFEEERFEPEKREEPLTPEGTAEPKVEPETTDEVPTVEFSEPAAPETGYEYVFSDGYGEPTFKKEIKPKRAKRKDGRGAFIAVACVAIVACMLLAFFVGFAGYNFWNSSAIAGDSTNQNGSSTLTPNTKANTSVVLEKVERTGSEYGSAGSDVFSESQVVKMVQDAVVVIEATVQSYYYGMPTTGTSAGSGVIISADGYVLTCNHVVNGATAVKVRLNDQSEYNAKLVGTDSTSDLAVLKIEAENLTYVKQGCSADLIPGEHVIAIGNPLGTLGGTVTSGIISATERNITTEDGTVMTLIQTDAAINSGNSGGGLFNLRGELVGIVNSKYASSGVEGLAFAIPVDSAFVVEKDLIQYGYVRGVIDDGLTVFEVASSDLSFYAYRYSLYGITKPGIYVETSKYCKDLEPKDRIYTRLVSLNGHTITTTDEWNAYLKENCKVGDTITVVAERNGKTFTTTLTLQEYVPDSALR